METDVILKKLERMKYAQTIEDFISSLDLTQEQFEILLNHKNESVKLTIAEHPALPKDLMYELSENEDKWVRQRIAQHSNLPEDLMYKLSEDGDKFVRWDISEHFNLYIDLMIKLSCDSNKLLRQDTFKKLKNLNSLSSDDLESAYDLIRKSKHIGREHFKETFDYIADRFPELNKLAKMFKRIILKGKKDLK